MTTTKTCGGREALDAAEQLLIQQALAVEPMVRDERDLPPPLDVLGARFHAAKIRFKVRATQRGYGLELVLPWQPTKRERILARTETIWLGTR